MKIIKKSPIKKRGKFKKKLGYTLAIITMVGTAAILRESYLSPKVENTVEPKTVVISPEAKKIEELSKENAKLRQEIVSRGLANRFWYDYSKLSCPENIVKIIKSQTDRISEGQDAEFRKDFFDMIYCIVGYESGFNPKIETKTSIEHSIGLLQINTWSNYPKGSDISKLRDPNFNLAYQLPELWEKYLKGKSNGISGVDLACYISRHGQRARWSDKKVASYITNSIRKYYKELNVAKQ